MKIKKRRGFVPLKLAVAVMVIIAAPFAYIEPMPQEKAKAATAESNYKTLASAYAMYQTEHQGEEPTKKSDLAPYISGGWFEDGTPEGATYSIGADGVITVTFDSEDDSYDWIKTYPLS